jgi:hypothetical protein
MSKREEQKNLLCVCEGELSLSSKKTKQNKKKKKKKKKNTKKKKTPKNRTNNSLVHLHINNYDPDTK